MRVWDVKCSLPSPTSDEAHMHIGTYVSRTAKLITRQRTDHPNKLLIILILFMGWLLWVCVFRPILKFSNKACCNNTPKGRPFPHCAMNIGPTKNHPIIEKFEGVLVLFSLTFDMFESWRLDSDLFAGHWNCQQLLRLQALLLDCSYQS